MVITTQLAFTSSKSIIETSVKGVITSLTSGNSVATAILFKWFSALKHVFHTGICAYLANTVCTVCYIYWPITFNKVIR